MNNPNSDPGQTVTVQTVLNLNNQLKTDPRNQAILSAQRLEGTIQTVTEPPLLVLDQVSRNFGQGDSLVQALKQASFTIHAGDRVVIAGPSGSGKSTLLNILGLLDPGYLGEITLDGQKLEGISNKERDAWRARLIGFVFQDFQLVSYLNVTENVEFGLTYDAINRSERQKRVTDILSEVGLQHRAKAKVSTLSGGEKQRLAIARTLVRRPKILLADEPTGNLDQKTSAKIMELLFSMQKELGYALIVVTHDPGIVTQFPHRIQILDGEVTVAKNQPVIGNEL